MPPRLSEYGDGVPASSSTSSMKNRDRSRLRSSSPSRSSPRCRPCSSASAAASSSSSSPSLGAEFVSDEPRSCAKSWPPPSGARPVFSLASLQATAPLTNSSAIISPPATLVFGTTTQSASSCHLGNQLLATQTMLLCICFFSDRIAKWCCEIRQVLRLIFDKL
nr:uncharacterized protein LOC127327065 [Lolium perenne]